MADNSNDPIAMWQNVISEMGKGFSSFASQAMAASSQSRPTATSQAGDASKQTGDYLEQYLSSMNLPSRVQMESLSERLSSMESQLREIKSLLIELRTRGPAPQADTKRGSPSAKKQSEPRQ